MTTERLVISNIIQFMNLAAKTPSILNIGGFTALRKHVATAADCSKCARAKMKVNDLRPQWEASFTVLSDNEKRQLKNMLDTKQICYYVKTPNGQLTLNCF